MHSVQFNVDGTLLAWVSHDSTVTIADSTLQKKSLSPFYDFLIEHSLHFHCLPFPNTPKAVIQNECVPMTVRRVVVVRWRGLPFTKCIWVAADSLVAAGHDYYPVLYKYSKGTLNFAGRLAAATQQAARGQQTSALYYSLQSTFAFIAIVCISLKEIKEVRAHSD